MKVTKDAMSEVFRGILSQERDELQEMENPQDLERFWFFRYDPNASMEWNTYQFHSMLELYKNKCRRWEEMHNGTCCVVERVRDKYLLPKIREWLSIVRQA